MTSEESTALRVARSSEPSNGAADESAAAEAPTSTTGTRPRPPLGSLLVEGGFVSKEQIQDSLRESEQTGERLGEVLLRLGLIGEHDLAGAIAKQWGLPFTEEADLDPDPRPSTLLQAKEMTEIGGVPVRFDDGRVIVAVADPTDERLACMHALLGHQVSLVVVTRSCLERLLSGEPPPAVAAPSPNGAERDHIEEQEQPAEPPEAEAPQSEAPEAQAPQAGDETFEAGSLLAELDAAAATLAALRPRLGEIGGALAQAEEHSSALADAERRLVERDGRVRELTAAFDAEKARAADLDGTLETERARATEFGAAMEAERARAAELGAAVETERARAAELAAAMETEQTRGGELAAALEAEQARTAELGAALETERARTGELGAAVEERDRLVAAVRAKLAAVTDALSA